MINIENYDTTFSINNSTVQYLFQSSGKEKLIKGVQYSKFETKRISDRKSSNNGDARKVFNTVLNTIPKFLKEFPDFPIFIQGSDSHDSFEEECRISCSKNCNIICKNKDRRIRTYIHFLDKKIKAFSKDYTFYGFDEVKKRFVEYEPKNKYTAILVYKKK